MTVTTGAASGLEDAYPLATLQAGMLYHSAYEPGALTYHDLTTVTLRGHFDRESFEAALAELAARHPVLRTSMDLTRFSEPVQLVHRSAVIPLEVTDLSCDPEAGERVKEWSEGEKRRPFDWSTPPLARCHVHLLADGHFAFSLSFHHAILDGWSVAALITELFRRYHAHLSHDPLPVTAPSVGFRELVAAERAALASEASQEFWRERVTDAPETRIPRLRGHGGEGESLVEVLREPVPPALLAELEQAARSLRVPLRTVLLAVHLRVLALVTGAPEVMTGLVTHGRPESEAGEEVLGLFLNTVPLRIDVTAPSWAALVRRVFDAEVALMPHRRYPLFEIQRASGRSPLLDVLFDFRDFHVYRGMPGIEVVDQEFFEQTDLPFATSFTRAREHGEFELAIAYDRNQFGAEQVAAIRDHYLTALRQGPSTPAPIPGPPAPTWSGTRPRSSGGTTPPCRTTPRRCTRSSPRRRCARPPRRPSATTASGSPTGSWRLAPAPSPTCWSRRGRSRATWWACAWTAAPTCCPRCWACSARARPTCRWSPRCPPTGSPT